MKVLITVAVWGREYAETFLTYSLGSQLSSNNIPKLAREHEVVYHIMTTRNDQTWFGHQSAIIELAKHCRIDWDIIEDHGFNLRVVPVGPDGSKYSFLSLLQNIAITRSLGHDALVFNYADFIWADGSLSNCVAMLREDADAVLTFCLPVDKHSGIHALDPYRQNSPSQVSILDLPARAGAEIAIRCLHREAKLRFWDGPAFTYTPTYLLWPVGKEGLIIRAYHQTILVLRVKPDDPVYRDGIPGGSLDGYYTAFLAEHATVVHADNSDRVMVFSLYDTPVNSQIKGGWTRDRSIRECLVHSVSNGQRRFAEMPLEIRKTYDHPELWTRVAQDSFAILNTYHNTVAHDHEAFTRNTIGVDLERMEEHWRMNSVAALSFQARSKYREYLVVFYQRFVLRIIVGRTGRILKRLIGRTAAHVLRSMVDGLVYGRSTDLKPLLKSWIIRLPGRIYRGVFLCAFSGSLGQRVKRLLGPSRARVLRRAVERIVYGSKLGAGTQTSLEPTINEVRALLSIGKTEALIERFMPVTMEFDVVPNVVISHRSAACFRAGIAAESIAGCVSNMHELQAILSTAATALRAVTLDAPLWADGHRAYARNLWFQGRFDEALRYFRDAERCLPKMIEAAHWDTTSHVLLPRNCAHVIGLMGHIDAFVKHKILTNDSRPYYLLAPQPEIVNPVFLGYWKRYINVVTEPEEIERLSKLEPAYGVNWNWVMPDGEGVVHVHTGIARVQRQWCAERREDLLHLDISHVEALARQKASWGMKEDDWFVCLHVRSPGFYAEQAGTAQDFRNTPIGDYYPLIHFITEMGGWVIRMGDPSVPGLNLKQCGTHRDKVIDYAYRPERSFELDVALSASCRLFVSSPSGLHTVAHAFGRPVCLVNFPIYAGFPWHPTDVFIPRRYFSHRLMRTLTFDEILSSDLVHADHHFHLQRAEIELLPNKPSDIVEAVREALNPETYSVSNPHRGQEVRQEFERLNREHGRDISGRLGLHYAVTYADELMRTDERHMPAVTVDGML